jgi:hypothetical protein
VLAAAACAYAAALAATAASGLGGAAAPAAAAAVASNVRHLESNSDLKSRFFFQLHVTPGLPPGLGPPPPTLTARKSGAPAPGPAALPAASAWHRACGNPA